MDSESRVDRMVSKLEVRVESIAEDVIELEKHQAVLDHRIKESEDKLKGFNDKGLWFFKLIIGGVSVAFLGFALKGGLVI
mgnify:CR=1 FL=1